MNRPNLRAVAATAAIVATGLGLAGCKAGSNQVDEERVERLLAEPIMAVRPDDVTVVQEPIGLVSEDANPQFADGGLNGALLRLELPADTSLDTVGRYYADVVEADGWKMITIRCFDSNPTDSILISGRKWLDDFEAGLGIEIFEPFDQEGGVDIDIRLNAPFHNSDGERPDDSEPDNDCIWK